MLAVSREGLAPIVKAYSVGNLVLPYYSIVYLYFILNLPCIMIGYINIE